MITIFKKELRDLLPWIAVGIIVIAVFCWQSALAQEVSSMLPVGFAAIALAFGFLQTIGDMRTDAKGYLLHRPISVKRIFWGKVFAGAVGYALAIAPPLIGLAIYFEAMGPQRMPTSGWDLVPTLVMSVVVFAFYPAAIWTMARQANWFGSKTVPLAFAGLGSILVGTIILSSAMRMPETYQTLVPAVLILAILVTLWITLAAAAYAYCESQFLPSPQSASRGFRIECVGILIVCFFFVSYVAAFVNFGQRESYYPHTDYQISMSDDGQLWKFAETQISQEDYYDTKVSVAKISPDAPTEKTRLQPRPANWTERKKAHLYTQQGYSWLWKPSFNYVGQFRGPKSSSRHVYEYDGRLMVYGVDRLLGVLTPDGFYNSLDEAQGKFVDPSFGPRIAAVSGRNSENVYLASSESMITDRGGVYQVDWNGRTVRAVLKQSNDDVAVAFPEKNQEGVFWVKSGTDVSRYKIEPRNEVDTLELADSDLVIRAGSYRFPEIKTTKTDQWSLGLNPIFQSQQDEMSGSFSVVETADRKTLFYRDFNFPVAAARYETRSPDGSLDQEGTITFPPVKNTQGFGFATLMPPVVVAVFAASALEMQHGLSDLAALIPFVLVNVLLATASTFWLTHRYALSRLSKNVWLLAALILGFTAPLAMWMIYPKLIRETCHHCEAMRRIDRDRCRQCGADWAKQPLEGNEILGKSLAQPSLASVVQT